MNILVKYLFVFLVGGLVCASGQVLINRTRMTSGRILVIFLLIGVLLESTGLMPYIKEFAGAGITIPIIGFGSSLARGAIEGSKESLLHGVLGGLSAVSGGLTAAIVFGFIFALICKSHSKKL